MAHIMGMTFVGNDKVFGIDESGNNLRASAALKASTQCVSFGHFASREFRLYAGTFDGNVAFFQGDGAVNPPQLFHVADQPVFWSLYHASGALYVGTGDPSAPGPFSLWALDDQTFNIRWIASSAGSIMYPVSVDYEGNAPMRVIVSSDNPGAVVRALDVNTGTEVWSAPDTAFGQRVHNGVVYYGNLVDSTLRARRASDGTLLWSFKNPSNFNFLVPVVEGGVVWASTAGNQVFALRTSDAQVLWEAHVGGHPGAPVVVFDHPQLSLVAVAEQGGVSPGFLQGIDANTGARLWTSNVPVTQGGESCSDPIIIPHFEGGWQVQVGTFDGRLMTFNAYNGQLAWQRQITPGAAIIARPHWVGW